MNKYLKNISILLIYFFLSVNLLHASDKLYINPLYQVSTLQALLAGEYDGVVAIGKLLKIGNMGLGTFDKLDGEMIIWEGKVYKARVDGKVYVVDSSETTPFANVARNCSGDVVSISFNGGYKSLKDILNEKFPESNKPVLFCIRGDFQGLSYRSVPSQEKPYRPLVEVVKSQAVFEKESAKGMLVGFRFPKYMSGINATGFHLHFLSADKTFGGHLLEVQSGSIKVTASFLNELNVFLPDTISTARLDKVDSDKDVERVEKLKK